MRAFSELELPPISLTDEERRILQQPLDPRVARILKELHEHRDMLEQLFTNRRIVPFQYGCSPSYIGRDENQSPHAGAIV